MPELLQWWNLVYVLAFFFALLYATLNAVGLASAESDVDVDADLDAEMDVGAAMDIDADVDMDIDVDADVDADMDVDADHDVSVDASEPGLLDEALSFFGIGKVPLSVIMMCFLLTFSIVGWSLNEWLKVPLRFPAVFFPISCASALFCGVGMTKLMAATLGRYLKPVETSAVHLSALVGRIGTARLTITSEFGTALVRDVHRSQHQGGCKGPEGAETIPAGWTVLLVRFVSERQPGKRAGGYYIVEPYYMPGE